jgi:hypothetical protein
MSVANQRFTVLTREASPTGEQPVIIRKKISRGTSSEDSIRVKEYNRELDTVSEIDKLIEKSDEKPGDVVSETLGGATFRWDMLINSKWHNLMEVVTIKELSLIPDSVFPGLQNSLHSTSKFIPSGGVFPPTNYLEVYISVGEIIAIVNKSKLLIDLSWYAGKSSLTADASFDSWFNVIGNKPTGY